MISLIFLILASICNAVMDVCSFHFNTSIFNNNKLNPKFWDGSVSWKNKYVDWDKGDIRRVKCFFGLFNYPVQLTDSFHLFKMLCIVFICSSIATFDCDILSIIESKYIRFFAIITIYGTSWNVIFMLFYSKILSKK